ncbi:MAG: DUF692 domain-containing protein [Polyangiaceae bacterium]
MSLRGIGLGFRPELAAGILASRDVVDLLEVVFESCFVSSSAWKEAVALSAMFPIVPHGVKLSLGSAEGIDRDKARLFARFARDVRATVVTEHVAFTKSGGVDVGHLTALPFTEGAVRVVARNLDVLRVTMARERVDVPVLLENAAWTLRWPDDAMPEGEFHRRVVEETGAGLLLDVANVFANAKNSGVDPFVLLRSYPLDAVKMVHLAGGITEGGFHYDSHAHPVDEVVFGMLAEVVRVAGDVPVVLERDGRFPPFAVLAAEMTRAREVVREHAREDVLRTADVAPRALSPRVDDTVLGGEIDLARAQATLAAHLVDESVPPSVPFDGGAVRRTRNVLERKRVDDAMPLLSNVAALGLDLSERGLGILLGTRRAPPHVAVADAFTLARAFERTQGPDGGALREAAMRDRLALAARFAERSTGDTLGRVPRFGPHVGRGTTEDGHDVWVVKGFGRSAPLRTFGRGTPAPRSARTGGGE